MNHHPLHHFDSEFNFIRKRVVEVREDDTFKFVYKTFNFFY